MSNEDVLKMIQMKYPTCSIIDYTNGQSDGSDIFGKCNQNPIVRDVGPNDMYKVTLCLGSFNVYVTDIEVIDVK
ncbi:MAG: hypothetical protein KAS32_04010 [Candidatus Peribacteraceae bacterium]|nr:hypothetical protein [Candidatus Peribacteraceae bacterium]